jgi:hypothetical protein
MDDQKINTTTSPINNLKINNSFKCSSAIKIFRLNKIIFLDFENILKYRKKFKSLDKFNAKDEKNNVDKFEIKNFNLLKNKIIDDVKSKPRSNIKINKASNPVNTVPNSNNMKINISKQEQKKSLNLQALVNKKKSEIYSQNFDVNLLKGMPPKINDLFLHDYSFSEKLIDKSNDTFGKLSKDTIPVAFYNHLMISEKNKKTINKNHKYFRTSITQRNKKKLLTFIYYSP